MINDLLFVYGSLLNTGNEFAAYLKNNAVLHCTGSFKGKLYDLGEYPGAIADSKSGQYVFGSIYQLHDPEKTLLILDDYEGFGAGQQQPNLFIREVITVETANGLVDCWIYLYNLSVIGFTQIVSGNYTDHLKQK